jgi:hypothetical protein
MERIDSFELKYFVGWLYLMKGVLSRKGIIEVDDAMCAMCKLLEKSVDHLLLIHCKKH